MVELFSKNHQLIFSSFGQLLPQLEEITVLARETIKGKLRKS